MRTYLKLALPVLALSLAMPLAHAQNGAAPPPPPSAQMQHGHNGQFRPHRNGQWGHGHWRAMRHHRHFMLARLVRNPQFRQRLGITAEQAQKIQTETFNFRKAQIQNHANIAVKRLELRNLLSATNPDRSAIDRTLQEISAARLTQAKAKIDFRLDMRAALTTEQRQKLQQMRQDFFRHRFDHPGPNGNSGMHASGANG